MTLPGPDLLGTRGRSALMLSGRRAAPVVNGEAPGGSPYAPEMVAGSGLDVTRAHHAVLGADAALGVTVDPWPATAGAPVALDPFADACYDLTRCSTFYGHGVVLAAAAGCALAWRYRLPWEDPAVAASWKPIGAIVDPATGAATPVDATLLLGAVGYAIGADVRLAAGARTRVVVRLVALPAADPGTVLRLGNLYGTGRDGAPPPAAAPYPTPDPGDTGSPGGGTPDGPTSGGGGGTGLPGGATPAARFYMFPSAAPSLAHVDPWTAPIDGVGTGHNFASGQRIAAYEAGVEHAYTTLSFQLDSAPLAAQTIVAGAWAWWLAGAVDVDGSLLQVRYAHLRLALVRSSAEVAVVYDSSETAEVGSVFGYPQSNFVGSAGAMAGATVAVQAGDRLRWEVYTRGHYVGPLNSFGDGSAEYNINVAYARNAGFGPQLGLQPPGPIFLLP